jgi:hypothetical protein
MHIAIMLRSMLVCMIEMIDVIDVIVISIRVMSY